MDDILESEQDKAFKSDFIKMEDGTDFDEGGEEEYNAPGQAAEGAEEDAGAEEGGEEYGEESGAAEEEVSITAATAIKIKVFIKV